MEPMNEQDPSVPIRLNRYLAQCGLGARRKCDEIIKTGHIFINGQKIVELGVKVGPNDKVEYHGTSVKPLHQIEYYAYHKPRGVMVTKDDPEGRFTLYDALKSKGFDASHLNYVGRLDFNSEGLLLLTNDGSLIHALTHPRYQIKKVYQVRIDCPLTNDDRVKFMLGVESDGQILHAGSVQTLGRVQDEYWYEIELFEGKNRQIRRMFEAFNYQVVTLLRIQFGSVKLGNLARAHIRRLTEREINALKNAGYPLKNEQ
jgi:23S rRNA pseudouridine2605 synthase